MSSSTFPKPPSHLVNPSTSMTEFHDVLTSSTRILVLCGAGLSAASGLGTFRGAGGMWRNHKATTLATPEAFERDPGLVWLFYSYRRHMALQASPNPGHYALAEAGRKLGEKFMVMTQNVDGLSQRADHPRDSLKLLHGSLFDIKCFNCSYIQQNNFDDPFHPLLAISSEEDSRLAPAANTVKATAAYLDPAIDTTTINPKDLPHCPECKTGLLRPGVVWFGEGLPEDTLLEVDHFIDESVDLMLVVGTTATVYPAASYVQQAKQRGARVVVVNMEGLDGELGAASYLTKRDFLFQGDAAELLPEMLKPIIGDLKPEQ